jgi:hypothetical protein
VIELNIFKVFAVRGAGMWGCANVTYFQRKTAMLKFKSAKQNYFRIGALFHWSWGATKAPLARAINMALQPPPMECPTLVTAEYPNFHGHREPVGVCNGIRLISKCHHKHENSGHYEPLIYTCFLFWLLFVCFYLNSKS